MKKFIGIWLVACLLMSYGIVRAAVTLNDFEVDLLANGNVEITWETGTETDSSGFYVQRSTDRNELTSPGGTSADLRVNDSLINARGDQISGANYSLIDDDVETGETYYYMLVDIELSGKITAYPEEIESITIDEDGNVGIGDDPTETPTPRPSATPTTPADDDDDPTATPTQEPTTETGDGTPTSTPRPTNTTEPTAIPDPDDDAEDDEDDEGDGQEDDGRVFVTPDDLLGTSPTDVPTDVPTATPTEEPTTVTGDGTPTSTPRPTNTPAPTSTPRPANTPQPTQDTTRLSGGGSSAAATDVPPTATPIEVAVVEPEEQANVPVAEAQENGYPVSDPLEPADTVIIEESDDGYVEPDVIVEDDDADVNGIGSNTASESIGEGTVIENDLPLPTTAVEPENSINPLLWLVFGAGVLVFGAGVVGSILIFTRKQEDV